jgi:hypothetical protein
LDDRLLLRLLEHKLPIRRREWNGRLGFNEAPHVPGSDRAVGAPPLAQVIHLRRAGHVVESVEHLHALAHTQVSGGEHVGAREGEDHEHMDTPSSDPLDHGEHGGEGPVVHVDNGRIGEDPGDVLAGEVVEVGRLARGDPDLAELVRGEREHGVGDDAGLAAEEREEAGVDGRGGLEGELLVEDGSDEGVERAVRAVERRRVVSVDDGGEGGVGRAQVADGRGDLAFGGEGPARERQRQAGLLGRVAAGPDGLGLLGARGGCGGGGG